MSTSSIKAKLMVDAFCAALSALVFGFCFVRTVQHFDNLYLAVMVLFGVALIADLLLDALRGPAVNRRRDCKQGSNSISVVLCFL
jgi:hypothetical protein